MKKSKLEEFSFEKYAKRHKPTNEVQHDTSEYVQEFITTLDKIGGILKDPEKLEERRKQYRELGE